MFQWHITDRCNLQCRHCYQEAVPPPALSWDNLTLILGQIRALREKIRTCRSGNIGRFHVTITGGEPLVHPDIFRLLEEIVRERSEWTFAILSNGTLIDEPIAKDLGRLAPTFVQISIDGAPTTHDAIRGIGSFERALAGIAQLKKQHIPVMLSFTATKENFREFPAVAELGRRLGVKSVWTDRVVPLGNAEKKWVLSPEETREYIRIIHGESMHARRHKGPTVVMAHRALQFIGSGETPYRCAAGNSLLTILADGSLCPCRRMPMVIANLLSDNLAEVYWNHPILQRLRDREQIPPECVGCFYARTCAGGLRCLSVAMYNRLDSADPGCWIVRNRSNVNEHYSCMGK